MITSAGKTVLCAGDATAYKCLALGANAKSIENGVVAKVTATLAPGVKKTGIALRDALGTSADGDELLISAPAENHRIELPPKERSPESGSPKTTRRKTEHSMKGPSMSHRTDLQSLARPRH